MEIRIKIDNDYVSVYEDASVGLEEIDYVQPSKLGVLPLSCNINLYSIQDIISDIQNEIDDYTSLEIIVNFN